MILSYAAKAALSLMVVGMAGTVVQAQEADTKWFAGGALIGQLNSAKDITNSSMGFGLNIGRDFQFKGYSFRAGFAINSLPGKSRSGQVYENFEQDLTGTPGTNPFFGGVYAYGDATPWSNKTSLMGYQVFGDFIFPSGFQKLDFTFGVSLNRWFYDATVTPESTGAYTVVRRTADDHIPGLKGGLRIGAEYRISKNLSAELLFQIVELGNNDGGRGVGLVDGSPTLEWRPTQTSALDTQVTITNPMYNKLTNGSNQNPSWLQLGVKYHF